LAIAFPITSSKAAGETFVEEAAERVDVGAAVHWTAFDLLGRDVRRRAGRTALRRMRAVVEPLGQSEVRQIEVLVLVEQHVRRLHVSVDKALCVRRVQRICDLSTNRERPDRRESALRAQQSPQIRALDEPHGEVEAPVDLAGVVDRYHVRVLERHRELRLAGEAFAKVLVECELGRNELQRNRPLQPQVVCAVDDTHAAPADPRLDPVADKIGSNADFGLRAHRPALVANDTTARPNVPGFVARVDTRAEDSLSRG
jgi:hypothetical protein